MLRSANHRPGDVKYDACGLPGVTLVDVEVSRCGHCGQYEVAIPRIDELHRAMATALARKAARLTPAEIRFLRTTLGWSGRELADHMGAAPETVSRGNMARPPWDRRPTASCASWSFTGRRRESFDLSHLKDVAAQAPADLRTRLIGGKSRLDRRSHSTAGLNGIQPAG